MNPAFVTLTTDFGTRDGFAAQMKGTILKINPQARIIDVTHDIEPYSITEAALVIKGMSKRFPESTIHVVVVDPGVGGLRRPIAGRTPDVVYVGPDNGFLSLVDEEIIETREISNTDFFTAKPHPTFHGRDIFAPAAAHLSLGKEFSGIGPIVKNRVKMEFPRPKKAVFDLEGEIIHIDRFGNLISNIDTDFLKGRVGKIVIKETILENLSQFYSQAFPKRPLALINSFGFLEIAVNQGNASEVLNAQKGTKVRVSLY